MKSDNYNKIGGDLEIDGDKGDNHKLWMMNYKL